MKAMIFAAGLGTRLKPFTNKHPKALAEVNGHTLLEWTIRYLQANGIHEVVVNVHHFADQIIRALKKNNGFGSKYHISDERDKVLETGGGLKFAAHFFEGEEKIIALNVDVLTTLHLAKLIAFHERQDAFATLAVMNRYSSRQLLFNKEMQLRGWKNNITEEVKKVPPINRETLTSMAFSGIQVLDKRFLGLNDFEEKFSIIDVYLKRAATHKVLSYDHSGDEFIDVGKPESLQQAGALFKW